MDSIRRVTLVEKGADGNGEAAYVGTLVHAAARARQAIMAVGTIATREAGREARMSQAACAFAVDVRVEARVRGREAEAWVWRVGTGYTTS